MRLFSDRSQMTSKCGKNKKVAVIFIVTVYICANFITSDDSVIYLLVLFPVAPLLVMCAAYYVIWRKQKSPICNHKNVIREAKLANTLFWITGASVFTWLPFQILNLLVQSQATANFSHKL